MHASAKSILLFPLILGRKFFAQHLRLKLQFFFFQTSTIVQAFGDQDFHLPEFKFQEQGLYYCVLMLKPVLNDWVNYFFVWSKALAIG